VTLSDNNNNHQDITLIKKRDNGEVIPAGIKHYVTLVNDRVIDKVNAVHQTISKFSSTKSILVFINKTAPMNEFVTRLKGVSSSSLKTKALHEAMTPTPRKETLDDEKLGLFEALRLERKVLVEQFKRGEVNILVTTDKSCRGLDFGIDDPLVILCDAPEDASEYVHLAGRTGRRGAAGVCVSFFTESNYSKLHTFMSHLPSIVFEPIQLSNVATGNLPGSWRIEDTVNQKEVERQMTAALPFAKKG